MTEEEARYRSAFIPIEQFEQLFAVEEKQLVQTLLEQYIPGELQVEIIEKYNAIMKKRQETFG